LDCKENIRVMTYYHTTTIPSFCHPLRKKTMIRHDQLQFPTPTLQFPISNGFSTSAVSEPNMETSFLPKWCEETEARHNQPTLRGKQSDRPFTTAKKNTILQRNISSRDILSCVECRAWSNMCSSTRFRAHKAKGTKEMYNCYQSP